MSDERNKSNLCRDENNCTIGTALAFWVANLGLIPNIPYGHLSLSGFLSLEPGINPDNPKCGPGQTNNKQQQKSMPDIFHGPSSPAIFLRKVIFVYQWSTLWQENPLSYKKMQRGFRAKFNICNYIEPSHGSKNTNRLSLIKMETEMHRNFHKDHRQEHEHPKVYHGT